VHRNGRGGCALSGTSRDWRGSPGYSEQSKRSVRTALHTVQRKRTPLGSITAGPVRTDEYSRVLTALPGAARGCTPRSGRGRPSPAAPCPRADNMQHGRVADNITCNTDTRHDCAIGPCESSADAFEIGECVACVSAATECLTLAVWRASPAYSPTLSTHSQLPTDLPWSWREDLRTIKRLLQANQHGDGACRRSMRTEHADGACRRSMPTEAAAKIGVGCGADIAGLLPRAHDVVVDLGKAERRCRRRIHEMPRVRALEVAACATACAHRPLCACLQAYVCVHMRG